MKKLIVGAALLTLMGGLSPIIFAGQKGSLPVMDSASSQVTAINTDNEADPDATQQSGVITTQNGDVIGAVVDFIFDIKANRVLYAISVLQEAEDARVFVLPWAELQVAQDSNSFVLGKNKETVQKFPNFPLDVWLELQPGQWKTTIDQAWVEKDKSYGDSTLAHNASLFRASELVDRTVQSASGEKVGALAELLIDPDKGAIAYAIVSFQDSAENNEMFFYPLPWSAIQVDPVQLTFVVPDLIEEKAHDYAFSQVDYAAKPAIFDLQNKNIYY